MARNKKAVQVVDETDATTATAVETSTEEAVKDETAKIEPTAAVETSTEEAVKDETAKIEPTAAVETSTEEAVKVEPAKSVEASAEEAVKDEAANVESTESVEDSSDEDTLAQKLMKDNRIQQIWRCPVSGYWFTREDYANDRAKTIGKPLTHFTLK